MLLTYFFQFSAKSIIMIIINGAKLHIHSSANPNEQIKSELFFYFKTIKIVHNITILFDQINAALVMQKL